MLTATAHIIAAVAESQSVLELVAQRLSDRDGGEEDATLGSAIRAAIARLDEVHELLHREVLPVSVEDLRAEAVQ